MSAATTLQAVSLAADLLSSAIELTARLQQVNALLAKARSEGRDITEAELESVVTIDDAAKARLQKAIDGA